MDIDVFVLVGQSNAVGMAKVSSLPGISDLSFPDVLIYNGGDCPAAEKNRLVPVHAGQGWGFGEEPYFGPELGMASVFSASKHPVAIMKYAYGGTAIFRNPDLNNKPTNHDNWHGPWDGVIPASTPEEVNEFTSGRLYTESLQTIRNGLSALQDLGYNPVVRGLVWMQGETDGEIQFNNNKYAASSVYEHNLTELFRAFRTELTAITGSNQTHMPIIFGEINEFSVCIVNAAEIVAAQKQVGKQADNYYISTCDLPIDPTIDCWHWTGKEAFELGVRFANTLKNQYSV